MNEEYSLENGTPNTTQITVASAQDLGAQDLASNPCSAMHIP